MTTADALANPDGPLLDLCAEALHHQVIGRRAYDAWVDLPHGARQTLWEEYMQNRGRVQSLLYRAKKIPATTAAGIYAKALCARASRTGAAELAMSLAEDLVNNHALRAMLWGTDAEPATTSKQAADNVVPLIPRSQAGRD